jgi:hypothetical protein
MGLGQLQETSEVQVPWCARGEIESRTKSQQERLNALLLEVDRRVFWNLCRRKVDSRPRTVIVCGCLHCNRCTVPLAPTSNLEHIVCFSWDVVIRGPCYDSGTERDLRMVGMVGRRVAKPIAAAVSCG